jgi:hypothetical protein
MRRTRLSLATALIVIACTRVAAAQPTPSAAPSSPTPPNPAADALFREGRTLMEAHRYAEACEKLSESQRLEPAAGTLLNLADCQEKSGRLAAAWTTYTEAAKAAIARSRPDWLAIASKRVAALEPKIAMLTISVAPRAANASGLRIERDGAVVAREEWDTTVAVDPGVHVITASAPGFRTWTRRVDLRASQKLITDVPPLESASETATPSPAPPIVERRESGATRIIGFTLAGVGVVGLGVGAFAGLRAGALLDDAKDRCTDYPSRCSSDARGPNDDSETFATVSTIALVAGGVLLVAGAVMVLAAPGADVKRASATRLRVGPGGLGATFW